jgi:glutamate synthase domain-containing protein 2/Na+-translocating ferredoxin:NAD+ oxidoreductase RNF subunit RnfB
VPPRFTPVAKFSSIEAEGCLGCLECVKRSSCLYDVYSRRTFDPLQIVNTGDSMCVSCMRCVQECKKGVLSRACNPQYVRLGDDYWTPDLITRIWDQAETGRIPVSGAGYGGPFAGPGFDSIWTDMSEIVRPTRDGIHGREYISTVIDLGRRPARLEFDGTGKLVTELPPFVDIPIPIVFDVAPFGPSTGPSRQAVVEAARELGTLAVAAYEEALGAFAKHQQHLMVKCDPERDDISALEEAAVAELAYSEDVADAAAKVKSARPGAIVSIRLPLDEGAADRASKLVAEGAEIVHLEADHHGRGRDGRFVTALTREVHLRLVNEAVRDQVTLLVTGGIAMAEHAAKTIICGADGVGVGLAHLIALECRVCRECVPDCPVHIEQVPVDWGAQRIVNLIGSWHSQLIEVLGAMGLREVRRLRGETGRAMFLDDLEQECFAPLFGERTQMSMPPESSPPPDLVSKGFPLAEKLVNPTRSRFRRALSKFKVVRTSACIACGKCAEVCAYGVHVKGGKRLLAPRSHLCRGPEVCRANDAYCGDHCPVDAIRVGIDPMWETFGDARWPADLLVGTWLQAETGRPPDRDIEYRVGASGGGFDRIGLEFPASPPDQEFAPEEVDLSVPLNRRDDDRPRITIGFPVYGGGMSFGSISLATMIARARAFKAFNSFTCSGEGGYPEELTDYDDYVITQVATGLFGVREETIQRVRMVEFKYAQGAKPGLGGHLLSDKVTPAVARMREAVEGSSLFSPFPFHSVYSVEDHKKHVDWIDMINPEALVAVKVSTPSDVDMVAVGSYYAGAHIIHLDGSYGGTGAAPDIAKKNIAMPIEYAIPKVHQCLVEEGIRDRITLVASGGLRTAWDVAKAIALGADAVVTGTAELVALECVRCGNCESGRGCPRGIATTDSELSVMYQADWAAQRLINMWHSWCVQLQGILWRLGMRSVRDLVGRTDVLLHHDYVQDAAGAGISVE